MKMKFAGFTALLLAVLLVGCSTLTTVLESTVILSTAAIPVACANATSALCSYVQLVNQDAEASVPISESATLTGAQVATELLPIWTNVAGKVFPNAPVEVAALTGAVSAVVQLIQQFSVKTPDKALVAGAGKPLNLDHKHLEKIKTGAEANLKAIAALRH